MTSFRARTALAIIALAGIIAVGAADYYPAWKAQRAYESERAQQPARIASVATLGNAGKCVTWGPSSQRPPQWIPHAKDCLIREMNTSGTVIGAVMAVTYANRWLEEHPQDIDVKRGAQRAIDGGWREYKASLPYTRAIGTFIAKCRASFLCTMFYAGHRTSLLRDEFADLQELERLELQLESPTLVAKQEARRVKLGLQ